MSGAPVAVSRDLQQYTQFASSGDGLVMRTCAPISIIRREASNVSIPSGNYPFGALVNDAVGNLNFQAAAMRLSPTAPYSRLNATLFPVKFTSPVWDLIGSAFTRYRVKKLSFHYEPQSSAVAGERMVFAFAADPEHPILSKNDLVQRELLALADSVAFMPWKEWSMDVSHRLERDRLFYTFVEPFGEAVDRFSTFGIISCMTDAQSATSREAGVLYMESEIEFVQFCPISTMAPEAAVVLADSIMSNHRKLIESREKPLDKLKRLKSERAGREDEISNLERRLFEDS